MDEPGGAAKPAFDRSDQATLSACGASILVTNVCSTSRTGLPPGAGSLAVETRGRLGMTVGTAMLHPLQNGDGSGFSRPQWGQVLWYVMLSDYRLRRPASLGTVSSP